MKELDNKLKRKIGTLLVVGIFAVLVLAQPVAADFYDTNGDGYVGNGGEERIFFDDDTAEIEMLDATVGIDDDSPDFKMELAVSSGGGYFGVSSAAGNDGDVFVIDSGGRVGIKDSSPEYKFEIEGYSGSGFVGVTSASDGDIFVIDTSGNIGIGDATPAAKLEINGNILFDKDSDRSISIESPTASHAGYKLTISASDAYSSSSTSGYVGGDLKLTGGAGAGYLSSTADGGRVCIYGGLPAGENDRGNVLILHDGTSPSGGRLGISTSSPTAVAHIANLHSTLDSFRVDGTAPYFTPFVIDADGDVGIGIASPSAMLHVDQSSTTAAKPVITLDQADEDVVLIKIIGTADSGNVDRTLVDKDDFGTDGDIVGWIQIEIDDEGNRIPDGDYYIPFFSAPE